jgi:hypothetical protein
MTDLSYNQVIKNGEGANNLKLYKGTNSYNWKEIHTAT